MIFSALSDRVIRASVRPKRIMLGPKQWMEFATEASRLYRFRDDGEFCFMGIPVAMEMPREFCRNCGAPTEPNVCSYCASESTTISLETT